MSSPGPGVGTEQPCGSSFRTTATRQWKQLLPGASSYDSCVSSTSYSVEAVISSSKSKREGEGREKRGEGICSSSFFLSQVTPTSWGEQQRCKLISQGFRSLLELRATPHKHGQGMERQEVVLQSGVTADLSASSGGCRGRARQPVLWGLEIGETRY